MLTESELLQSIHQSTNMGREGIQSVLNYAKDDRLRQALEQQLALKKQALSPVLEISDTAFIIRMLEKNHGLSFLPYLAVERDIRKGRIALLHVEDVEISMYRQIFYHKNKFKTREMEEFIRLAAE